MSECQENPTTFYQGHKSEKKNHEAHVRESRESQSVHDLSTRWRWQLLHVHTLSNKFMVTVQTSGPYAAAESLKLSSLSQHLTTTVQKHVYYLST